MELFYTRLWEEQLGKAEALWQAKKAMRTDGAPLRDWTGWVLTGDPDREPVQNSRARAHPLTRMGASLRILLRLSEREQKSRERTLLML